MGRAVADRETAAPPPSRAGDGKSPIRESAAATHLLLGGQMGGKALRFLTELAVGRILGPTGFGIVAASMSLTHILNEIGLMGTHQAVLRFVSVDRTPSRRSAAAVTRKGLAMAVGAAVVLATAVLIARDPLTRFLFESEPSPWILPVFAAALPAMAAFTVLQYRARGAHDFRTDMLVGSVARGGLPLLTTLVLFIAGWRLWGATVGFTLGMIGTFVLAAVLLARKRPGADPPPASGPVTGPSAGDIIRLAAPLALASASLLLMNELDKVMLAIFRPESEVGIYNAAYRISRQTILVMPALAGAVSPWVAPLLARSHGGAEELGNLYRQTTRWSLASGWSAALLFGVFAADFLGLLGPAYVVGVPLLVLLTFGQLVNACTGTAGVVLQFSGNEKKELGNGILVTILNVGLNLALIPAFGATGAAVATVISLTAVTTRRLLQVRKILGVFPHDGRTLLLAGAGVAGAGLGWVLRSGVGVFADGPVAAVAAAVLGMVAAWALFFRFVGVTDSEAALLRLPTRWVKRVEGV